MKALKEAMNIFAIPTSAPQFTGPPYGQWTLSDWERLPEDGNIYEIIDGMLYMTTAPSSFHHWITKRLYRLLGVPAEDQGIAEAAWAPIGVIMPDCDPVQPDFLLIRRDKLAIMHDGRIYGVPDLIIEIISPSSGHYDEVTKLSAYAHAGVPEYAVIDPAARVLRRYRLEEIGKYKAPIQYGEGESIAFEVAPSISVPISALFDNAPDPSL